MQIVDHKISVIVPIYNMEKYLVNCLDSILLQSFTNFEIVLINDGSDDNSGSICDAYAEKDRRIRIFHVNNGGVTKARKIGVEKASGDYICFVDADDTLPIHSLKLMLYKAVELDLDIILGAKSYVINGFSRNILKNKIDGIIFNIEFIQSLLNRNCSIGSHGKLFKKVLFDLDTFSLPREIRQNEDLVMNIRLALNSKKVGIFNNLIVYNYHHHNNSASQSQIMPLDLWIDMCNYCLDAIERANVYTQLKDDFIRMKLDTILILLKRQQSFDTNDWIIKLIAESKGIKKNFGQKLCVFFMKWPKFKREILFVYRVNNFLV